MSLLWSNFLCLDHQELKRFLWLLAGFCFGCPPSFRQAFVVPKEGELYQVECEADGVFPRNSLCGSKKTHPLIVMQRPPTFLLFAHRWMFGHHCECTPHIPLFKLVIVLTRAAPALQYHHQSNQKSKSRFFLVTINRKHLHSLFSSLPLY